MPEVPTGLVSSSGADRLNSLRQNSQSQMAMLTPRKIRIELLLGVGAFLVLLAVLFVLLGSRSPEVVSSTSIGAPIEVSGNQLRNGEALMAMALEEGSFPPDIQKGDLIRIVVTPNQDGSGMTHALDETTTVESLSGASEIGGRYVMTVRGPESVAIAVAASGSVHVVVLQKAQQ